MTPEEQPPAKFFWTKQLDLRLVHAIQEDLGNGIDVVKHQRKEGISVNWESVLQRVQNSPEGWPQVISSIEELKKRWDNNYRVWYAKKAVTEVSEDSGKLRASHIHLPTLFTLLTQRDYLQESKPGPRKGTKMQKRKKRSLESLDSSLLSNDEPVLQGGGEEEEDLESGFVSDQLSAQKQQKKDVTSSTPPQFDSRLESWLSFLLDPKYQVDFRIHTHSNLILEPKILVDGIIHENVLEPFSHFLLLAKAVSPPQWTSRILSLSDTTSIHLLIAQKESCFLLPSEKVVIDNKVLLFILVQFPESSETPTIWSFLLGETRQHNLEDRIANLIGVSLHEGLHWRFQFTSPSSSNDLLLQALDLFNTCLTNFTSKSEVTTLTWSTERREVTRNKLLSLILLSPSVSLRLVPPRKTSEPLSLPFKSLHETIMSLGLQLPPWCFHIPEKEAFLSAVHDLAKVLIKVIPLDSHQTIVWNRKSDDKELLLIAEKNRSFGSILSIHNFSQSQATLTLLGNLSCFKRLGVCGVNFSLDKKEHIIQLSSQDFSLEMIVNDIQIQLKF